MRKKRFELSKGSSYHSLTIKMEIIEVKDLMKSISKIFRIIQILDYTF